MVSELDTDLVPTFGHFSVLNAAHRRLQRKAQKKRVPFFFFDIYIYIYKECALEAGVCVVGGVLLTYTKPFESCFLTSHHLIYLICYSDLLLAPRGHVASSGWGSMSLPMPMLRWEFSQKKKKKCLDGSARG